MGSEGRCWGRGGTETRQEMLGSEGRCWGRGGVRVRGEVLRQRRYWARREVLRQGRYWGPEGGVEAG